MVKLCWFWFVFNLHPSGICISPIIYSCKCQCVFAFYLCEMKTEWRGWFEDKRVERIELLSLFHPSSLRWSRYHSTPSKSDQKVSTCKIYCPDQRHHHQHRGHSPLVASSGEREMVWIRSRNEPILLSRDVIRPEPVIRIGLYATVLSFGIHLVLAMIGMAPRGEETGPGQ